MLELLALLMQQCLFFLGYITGRSEFPPALNRAEEAELIGKLDAGDHNARQELITHNLRLVSHIARKYQIPGYGADDLISIGVIGLIKAVDSFKSASGTPLGTYAARCIENEILMTLRASRKRRGDVSLSDPVGSDGEGNDITYQDILGTDADAVSRPLEDDAERTMLLHAIETLCERDRRIILLRFGIGGTHEATQKEVADLLGISQSYISRLEKRIIVHLRQEMLRQMQC